MISQLIPTNVLLQVLNLTYLPNHTNMLHKLSISGVSTRIPNSRLVNIIYPKFS
jgi:hypothetical protein